MPVSAAIESLRQQDIASDVDSAASRAISAAVQAAVPEGAAASTGEKKKKKVEGKEISQVCVNYDYVQMKLRNCHQA